MKVNEKNPPEKNPSTEESKGFDEKNLRNFENTFLHDWKRVLKRVDEGRKCCEMLSRIFVEIIRVETEYESNLRNICELFKEFDDESCGIKNGINSLKTNIERRCEQIKEFVNSIEGEILNNTLSTTLINHKNVFDQIKVDGIENEKIVEKTKKESIKSIENCVNAYESLIDSIHSFQSNAYLHPFKKIELSNICINKYLLAKKKEDEYKNTIHIIKEIELKKEKRLKSILYSLESMDYKRISCIKDNIMKYLIFFTSYIRNVQYDLNTSINIFKDICAYEEIKEYCILHSKTEKPDFEKIIFFTNIVSWPMLIDYLGELNNTHRKYSSKSKYEALEGSGISDDGNSNKQGNIFSNLFNVNIYKNFIPTNNKKTPAAVQNTFYSNILNEITFFNKKDCTSGVEGKEWEEKKRGKETTESMIVKGKEEDAEKEDALSETKSVSNCESPSLHIIEDINNITSDVITDSTMKSRPFLNESCSDLSNFERIKRTERGSVNIDVDVNNSVKEKKKEEEEEGDFTKTEDKKECLEKEDHPNSFTDIDIKEKQKEIHIFEHYSPSDGKQNKGMSSDDNGSSSYKEKCSLSDSAKKKRNEKESFSSDFSFVYNLSHNIKDDLKKMEIYFFFYLNNLYVGNFERIAHINITKYFNVYSNRFVFCECLMNFIKKNKTKFSILKSIVVFANVILKFLDYCSVYVDYWSTIYILVASENFYFEVERNSPLNIDLLLSKYTFFDKSKNVAPLKTIEVLDKKKISEQSDFKSTVKSEVQSEKVKSGLEANENEKSGTIYQKILDKMVKVAKEADVDEPNEKGDIIFEKNPPLSQIENVMNIYENEKSNVAKTSDPRTCGSDHLELMRNVEVNEREGNKIIEKEKEKKEKKEKNEKNEKKGNGEVVEEIREAIEGEQYRKVFLHKFLYAHNLWNNIKFWEVCFLIIISEIIQEIILLEKYRYENKEEMIKKYFFFFKYFNFYNSMINFGLSVNQIGLLLNKIFHHFHLKNDPIARKYFFQIIDITTNKNISLNYIKMDATADANFSNYKNYYLQYYNNFFNDEKKYKKNT